MARQLMASRWGAVLHLSVLALVLGPQPRPAEAADTVSIVGGLDHPVWVESPPGDFQRLFIVEQKGVIKIFDLLSGQLKAQPFLDIQAQVRFQIERGLHSIAFHPNFAENGFFFLKYSNLASDTVIARFSVTPSDPDVADPASEQILLTVPQEGTPAHKGGNLAFHPFTGYLYIPLGEGTFGWLAQDGTALRGKLLRIDVDAATYTIPPDNPFTAADDPQDLIRDEIWTIGLRNPYRLTFDRLTGDLYLADVGNQAWEELHFSAADSPGGENYGWRCMEGNECTGFTGCDCVNDDLSLPILTYDHASAGGSGSIIGGSVYRGLAIPSLQGSYIYGDYVYDWIKTITYVDSTVTGPVDRTNELTPASGPSLRDVVGFCEDSYGELYIVKRANATTGEIFKIIPEDLAQNDCNGNLIFDPSEIAAGLETDCNRNGVPDSCELAAGSIDDVNGDSIPDICQEWFVRGDATLNGGIEVADAIDSLAYLFQDLPSSCLDALDANDDGTLDVSDPIQLLGFQFLGGPPPPNPYPDCGLDSTDDALNCESHLACP